MRRLFSHLCTEGPSVRRLVFVLLAAASLFACSLAPTRPEAPETSAEAGRQIARIVQVNRELSTFKGIGTLRLKGAEGLRIVRAAWIAQMPDRLRLELLGVGGAPVASLAADGTRFSLYLHDRRKTIRRRSANDGLQQIIDIDMTVEEVVSLLGGRVLLDDFSRARVQDGVLVLEDSGGRVLQKIAEQGRTGFVRMLESFDRRGGLRFRATMAFFGGGEGISAPDRIRIAGRGPAELRLSVDRFWANPAVPPDTFAPVGNATGSRNDP